MHYVAALKLSPTKKVASGCPYSSSQIGQGESGVHGRLYRYHWGGKVEVLAALISDSLALAVSTGWSWTWRQCVTWCGCTHPSLRRLLQAMQNSWNWVDPRTHSSAETDSLFRMEGETEHQSFECRALWLVAGGGHWCFALVLYGGCIFTNTLPPYEPHN